MSLENEIEGKIHPIVEIVAEQLKEYKYKGSKKCVRGLKWWEFDLRTHEVKEVIIQKEVVVTTDGKPKSFQRAFHNPHAIYHQAHNYRAAYKKFRKLIEILGGLMKTEND